ncbi:DUF1768-domain-containing protein [Mycena sanguinolenta]|nr:DUF1768-domain-containing protein [Mycena sanguinolenta]
MPQLTLGEAFARARKESVRAERAPRNSEPVRKKPAEKILFGPSGPYANLDQFSPHPVNYNEVVYPTSQHLFQAFKFMGHRPDLAERVRMATTCEHAFNIAHANDAAVRNDWVSLSKAKMEEALCLKFFQHPLLLQELVSTGDSDLYLDSAEPYWGVGPDLLGRNEFGIILERVRESLGGAKAPVRKVIMCKNCRTKPRSGQSLYCGNTCLAADISSIPPLCPQCRRRPQVGRLKYCGTTCQKAARS